MEPINQSIARAGTLSCSVVVLLSRSPAAAARQLVPSPGRRAMGDLLPSLRGLLRQSARPLFSLTLALAPGRSHSCNFHTQVSRLPDRPPCAHSVHIPSKDKLHSALLVHLHCYCCCHCCCRCCHQHHGHPLLAIDDFLGLEEQLRRSLGFPNLYVPCVEFPRL